MRITRVALSFFSVGFLAGSFEQAAGLGNAERAASPTSALERVALPSALDLAASSLDGQAKLSLKLDHKPSADGAPVPQPVAPVAEAGDASAAQTFAALAGPSGHEANAEPVALAPATEPSARKLRPFFDPSEPEADALVAPEPKLANRPQEFILPFEKGRVTSM